MLEIVSHKLPSRNWDDLRWPLLTASDTRLQNSTRRPNEAKMSAFNSDDDDEEQSENILLSDYWEFIRSKYQQLPFDLASLSRSKVDALPANWTVVHIYLTEDQNTMFVCRQRANQQPLVFSLPLKGRRETEEDEHLTFQDAIAELREIVRLSDEGTRSAINVKGQDKRARAAWWADRAALDKRLEELLESIEFCWFGAFKVYLNWLFCLSTLMTWCRPSSANKSQSLRRPCRLSETVWAGYSNRASEPRERSKASI